MTVVFFGGYGCKVPPARLACGLLHGQIQHNRNHDRQENEGRRCWQKKQGEIEKRRGERERETREQSWEFCAVLSLLEC